MPELADVVPELVCLGIDAAICGAVYIALRGTNTVLRQLSAAPELPLDDQLVASLENHPAAVRSAVNNTVRLPYAAVRGEVDSLGKTVTSAYAPGELHGVIQKVVFTEHKRNMSRTGFWVDSQRVMHSYTNEAPFCLTPTNTSPSLLPSFPKLKVEVIDWNDAARVDLDTVYDQFDSAENNLGRSTKLGYTGAQVFQHFFPKESQKSLESHLWGWVVGDMQKGVQKTEEMLVKGSTITGIGEVVSGPMGVRLQPPADGRPYYLVKNSLSSLIKEVEGSRSVLKVCLGVFGGIGLLIASMTVWKLYKKRRAEEAEQRNQRQVDVIREERVARGPRPDGDNIPEALQCVVCLGAEREVILLDCGHVCACADCAAELLRMNQGCPVCRSPIERVGAAYIS